MGWGSGRELFMERVDAKGPAKPMVIVQGLPKEAECLNPI